jgi:hypothetical protein
MKGGQVMHEPLKQWYCDVCGDIIKNSRGGRVIWKSDENHCDYDFKIIHMKKCDNKRLYPSSMSLDTFLGEQGVQYLLQFLSRGKIKENLGQTSRAQVKDMNEFVDFFRRVQTPYYEEARTKFNSSTLLDDFSDDNEVGPYLEERLKKIINEY